MNIYEIAQKAGVSIASVSRVLNHKPGISLALREKITAVMKDEDYRPNQIARGLACRKTGTVGVILPGINNYFTALVDGADQILQKSGYSLLLASGSCGQDSIERELKNLHLLEEKMVDGILFFVSQITPSYKDVLRDISGKIPVIAVGQEIDGVNIPSVVLDYYQGAKLVMEHLIELGHRKIAFINGPEYSYSAGERYRAYCEELQSAGIDSCKEYIGRGGFALSSGFREGGKLLALNEPPTAIFAANDNMAIGTMRAAWEKGVRIPQELAVAGFDDLETSSYTTPPLTSVRQNPIETGRQAAQLLLEKLERPDTPVKKIRLSCELMIRESTQERSHV